MRSTLSQILDRLSDSDLNIHKGRVPFVDPATQPVPCIDIAGDGSIIDANATAALLLNVTPRHLVGRAFPMFLSADRPQFLYAMTHVQRTGRPTQLPVRIRPRERAPFDAALTIRLEPSTQLCVVIEAAENASGDTSRRPSNLTAA